MSVTQRLGGAMRFAVDHHHLLTTAAMLDAGLTHEQVSRLARDGVIERIIRGLYRLPGTRSAVQDAAAVLLRRRAAVLSHTTALFLHDLEVRPPRAPHFTLPPTSGGSTSLGRLHRSPLDPADTTRRRGLAVTTLARSIVDASEQLTVDQLAAVLNEAVSRRLVVIDDVTRALGRAELAPGRTGLGRMRAALDPWTERIRPDSPAEAAAIRRIVEAGLPAPVTQHEVRTADGVFVARLDMAWPDDLVAREYDSARHHGPDRTEADELRLRRLEALGWTVRSVHRRHLPPGEDSWLRVLATDLGLRRRSAS